MPFEQDDSLRTPGFVPDVTLSTPGFVPDSPPARPQRPSVTEFAMQSVNEEQERLIQLESEMSLPEFLVNDFQRTQAADTYVADPTGFESPQPLTESEQYVRDMRMASLRPPEEAEVLRKSVTTQLTSKRIEQIHEALADKERAELAIEHADKMRQKFGAKTWKRWERGVAMVVGGGFHLMEELALLSEKMQLTEGMSEKVGGIADDLGNAARWYHKALEQPEMQPVIDNWFDKYVGGATETGPFMAAAFAPAVVSGGATIPTAVAGFLTSYAVEGNNIYQEALDRNLSEREARMRGTLGGIINGGIEVAGGGAGKYLKQAAASKALTKLQKANKFGRCALKNALKEGLLEEVPQEAVTMVVGGDAPLDADGNLDLDATVGRLVDSAVMGTILGGFADSMVKLSDMSYQARTAEKEQLVADTIEVYAEQVAEEQEADGMSPIGKMSAVETAEARMEREAVEQLVGRYGVSTQEAQAILEQERGKEAAKPQESEQTTKTVEEIMARMGVTRYEAYDIAGIKRPEYTGPSGMSDADALSSYLDSQDKTQGTTPTQRMNRTGFAKIKHTMQKGLSSWEFATKDMARLMEKMDGMSKGPLYNFFVKPARAARDAVKERQRVMEDSTMDELRDAGLQSEWATDVEIVAPGVELTTAQKIFIAASAGNEHQMRQITEGMGIDPDTIAEVIDELGDPELKVVGVIRQKLDALATDKEFAEAIEAIGVDPETVFKEIGYMSIYRTDKLSGDVDPFSSLVRIFDDKGTTKPEARMLEERDPGAVGEINMDPIAGLLNTLSRIERIKVMAPLAKQFAGVLNDPRFQKSVQKATYNQGLPTIKEWMEVTVRGKDIDKAKSWVARVNKYFRTQSRTYLLGHNAVTAAVQAVSLPATWAADKRVMGHTLRNAISLPQNYKDVRAEVWSKSSQLRSRQLYTPSDKNAWTKDLDGNQEFKDRVFGWIKSVDEYVVVLGWKSLYDAAVDPQGRNMSEERAIEFADDWIAKTQPMPDAMDLPRIFRGGELAKTFTQFQRVPIQVWNTAVHDIAGQFQAGNITKAEATRRAIVALVIPAILMSMVRRGRPPKSPEEVAEDIFLYNVSNIPLVGGPVRNMMQGFDSFTPISLIPLDEANKARQALMRGDPRGVISHSLKSIGSGTGTIPLQYIRTGEGLYDLLTGETDDVRRLLYSEYALKEKD